MKQKPKSASVLMRIFFFNEISNYTSDASTFLRFSPFHLFISSQYMETLPGFITTKLLIFITSFDLFYTGCDGVFARHAVKKQRTDFVHSYG